VEKKRKKNSTIQKVEGLEAHFSNKNIAKKLLLEDSKDSHSSMQ
jgi:hypothetical protein